MKKLFWLLVITFVVGIVLAALGYHVTSDAPPPQVDDLRLQRPDIPEKENGYYYFNLASEKLYWPEDEDSEDRMHTMLDGEAWDQELVAELLDRNAEAFEYFERGVRCSQCQVPEVKSIDDLFPYLGPWRQLASLSRLRAMWLFKQGREKEAVDQAMRIVRFGDMIEGSGGALIHYLVGMAVKAIGLQRLEKMASEVTLEPALLTEYAGELGQYRANEKGLKDALKVEYAMMEKMVDDVASGKHGIEDLTGGEESALPHGYTGHLFQPNKTKMIFARTYRVHMNNISRTYAERDFSELPRLPEASGLPQWIKLFLSGNAIGKMLVSMVLPAFEKTHLHKCKENVRVGVVQLLFALKAYKLRTGNLPQSLEQLVPDYLESVPLDDFDGEPLRYSPEKRIIYSVGEDLKDGGGSEGEEPWHMKDPTFRIEF